jgi:hypothetical protein
MPARKTFLNIAARRPYLLLLMASTALSCAMVRLLLVKLLPWQEAPKTTSIVASFLEQSTQSFQKWAAVSIHRSQSKFHTSKFITNCSSIYSVTFLLMNRPALRFLFKMTLKEKFISKEWLWFSVAMKKKLLIVCLKVNKTEQLLTIFWTKLQVALTLFLQSILNLDPPLKPLRK